MWAAPRSLSRQEDGRRSSRDGGGGGAVMIVSQQIGFVRFIVCIISVIYYSGQVTIF